MTSVHLSQLALDSRSPAVLNDLGSPSEMHKTLWRGFPNADAGGPGRVIFRVDLPEPSTPHGPVVLVQSEQQPDWSALPCGYLAEPARSKPLSYDGLVSTGETLRFRLLANPTKKVRVEGKKNGNRYGLLKEADQIAWLVRKGEAGGFAVDFGSLLVTPLGMLPSRPARPMRSVQSAMKGQPTWLAVRYTGLLRVTDAKALAATLTAGIGSAKAFGFGLLSVAPVGY